MQEIKKRRIVLASVLKPANEPRMFDKIGSTLANDYDVYCIGAPLRTASNLASNPKVVEIPNVKRLSLSRLFVPFKILRKVIELRPALLIICTHELLLIAWLAKLITRCTIIYDVQENYYRNIRYGTSFPFFLRELIASYVRTKEVISKAFVSHYFLAEKAYKQEMTFFGTKKTILENKTVESAMAIKANTDKEDGCIQFLFSGTLAETTGVFIAIDVMKKLHELDNKVRLNIVGYSADRRTVDLIRSAIQNHDFIQLKGGNTLVAHNEIVSEILSADFGIISYPPNPSTANSVPTKLFEYLACSLPILLIDNPQWLRLCEPYNAAIPFNPQTFSASSTLKALKEQKFYTTLPQDVFWSSEEQKLLQTIETLGI